MSWQIPTLIEQDIKNGKAQYRTFQTGNGGQSILPVPSNSYVVIFGYDFSPAGGGFTVAANQPNTDFIILTDQTLSFFETQQIAFYTGTDFYPFIHHVDIKTVISTSTVDASAPDNNIVTSFRRTQQVDNTPIARQTYITSTNDVTITVGLIQTARQATQNPIPVTNRTPLGLTYGGSVQSISTQTNYGPIATPQQFMQPSPKDYQDFAFGLLPANADGQTFATPDILNGLCDPNQYILGFTARPDIVDRAASQYYLCLHYAIYPQAVPESRG